MTDGADLTTLSFRVKNLEDEVRLLQPLASDVAVLKTELTNISRNVADLSDGVKSLRTTLIGAAMTVAASAIGFAITVLAVIH